MTDDASAWKRCSTCKKPIGFASAYFTCSVSTCNRKGTDFAFCEVSCWDAHASEHHPAEYRQVATRVEAQRRSPRRLTASTARTSS